MAHAGQPGREVWSRAEEVFSRLVVITKQSPYEWYHQQQGLRVCTLSHRLIHVCIVENVINCLLVSLHLHIREILQS